MLCMQLNTEEYQEEYDVAHGWQVTNTSLAILWFTGNSTLSFAKLLERLERLKSGPSSVIVQYHFGAARSKPGAC